MNENRKVGDLRIWWIPQVPSESFEVDVASVEEAVKLLKILADYDAFQFEHHTKPDYSNAGGLQRWCDSSYEGKDTSDWEDWYDEETGEDDPEVWVGALRENRERIEAQIGYCKLK